jgi:hypothetical protein
VKAAEEVAFFSEQASDLANWGIGGRVLLEDPIDHGDGTETRRYRSLSPVSAELAQFFRLVLEQR